MTAPPGAAPPGMTEQEHRTSRNIGLGCFTFVIGGFSGGMIGVLLGKVVGGVRKCVPPEGLPACDWQLYWAVGAVLGALSLPILVLWRLRQR